MGLKEAEAIVARSDANIKECQALKIVEEDCLSQLSNLFAHDAELSKLANAAIQYCFEIEKNISLDMEQILNILGLDFLKKLVSFAYVSGPNYKF